MIRPIEHRFVDHRPRDRGEELSRASSTCPSDVRHKASNEAVAVLRNGVYSLF
jgi:hypothetical protein